MRELYSTAPTFVPKPYTWGKLDVSNPDAYFFPCEFIDMTNQEPDPVQFCTKLKKMHQTSVSPTGKFGFHVNTCQGNLAQQTTWNSSWVQYYIQLVRGAMRLNTEINGKWRNLQQCVDRLISHVVPQVLGPLGSDGRVVKPCVIHGDLWSGNTGTDRETGEVHAFDASVHYAHHEMEVAIWRGDFGRVFQNEVYLKTYLSMMGKSEPKEQFKDRKQIYSIYHTLHESACHQGLSFREECFQTLDYLIDKRKKTVQQTRCPLRTPTILTMTSSTDNFPHDRIDLEKQTGDASPIRSPPSVEVLSSTADDTALSTQREPYSYFTKKQKRLIVFIIAFAATFSPLSSLIFFPAINVLPHSLHVSVEKINLTITSYR
ncbi:MAG: hypothetical protein Q9203_006138 [Teloschistes exilis]